MVMVVFSVGPDQLDVVIEKGADLYALGRTLLEDAGGGVEDQVGRGPGATTSRRCHAAFSEGSSGLIHPSGECLIAGLADYVPRDVMDLVPGA